MSVKTKYWCIGIVFLVWFEIAQTKAWSFIDTAALVFISIALSYILVNIRDYTNYKTSKAVINSDKVITEAITEEEVSYVEIQRKLTKNEHILICEACKQDDFHCFVDADGRTIIICSSCGWKRFN